MVQGTGSNVGKSLLVAGLCRLLASRGLRVAPFKAQNMSLNSWVTNNGHEIGIAQALQARACCTEPTALMNPVLLKPVGHLGSQVILLGKPLGIMTYRQYTKIKPQIWHHIRKAYDELGRNYDCLVLEGAGSPAEINLSRYDLANMAMAAYAGAKVLLAADIDRGGAFAALAGTMQLIKPRYRKLVGAFCLNKFRGDANLLKPAIKRISRLCQTPFLGTIPFIDELNLPEEDSFGLYAKNTNNLQGPCLDIAIVNLPGISNISDWDALRCEPDVRLRMLSRPEDIGHPDLLILPGSRTVPKAIRFLHDSGLAKAIKGYCSNISGRGNILGICAGLQIMGAFVNDPLSLEGGGTHRGLAILPHSTTICKSKILDRQLVIVDPVLTGSQHTGKGYEIHHGVLHNAAKPVMWNDSGQPMGWGANSNPRRIWGTWLHGILATDSFRHALLSRLRKEAGLKPQEQVHYEPDADLNKLATILEQSLDMGRLMSWLTPQKPEKTRCKAFHYTSRIY